MHYSTPSRTALTLAALFLSSCGNNQTTGSSFDSGASDSSGLGSSVGNGGAGNPGTTLGSGGSTSVPSPGAGGAQSTTDSLSAGTAGETTQPPFTTGGNSNTPAVTNRAGGSSVGNIGNAGASGSVGGSGQGTGGDSTGEANLGPADGGTGEEAGTGVAVEPEPIPPENLPDGVLDMFPVPDATDLCTDPSLYLRFAQSVHLANSGRFLVYDSATPGQPVATVDLGQQSTTLTMGGAALRVPPPAFAVSSEPGGDTDTVVVSLAGGQFSAGHSYQVQLEGNPVVTQDGAPALAADLDWTFSTRDGSPPNASQLTLGYSSHADYCSLQGALDAASNGTEIQIEPKTYYGLARLNNKSGLTLRGQDQQVTQFVGINNEQLNGGTRSRPLFLVQNTSELTIENLTIKNLTPQGGSQAEALAMLDCDKCIVRDTTIESLQDTLLWQGRIYAEQCLIIGNVDYIWGTGTAYFNQCEIRTVGRKGYNIQARNDAGSYGYVFVDSKLTADPGITGDILARIEIDRFPGSQVAYVDCEMGSHIAPEGWLITGGSPSSQLRFWEYQSRTPSGDLVDTSRRAAGSRQMTAAEADTFRDPANVFGGWSP